MRSVARWTLPTELERGETEAAAALLRTYFCDVEADRSPRYPGAAFERLGGGGDRAEIADIFTAEDVVAVSLLSVSPRQRGFANAGARSKWAEQLAGIDPR